MKMIGVPRNIAATLEGSEEEIQAFVEKHGGYLFRTEGSKGHAYCWMAPNRSWFLILPEKDQEDQP